MWKGCLHAWALAKLHRGEHRFGMYFAAVVPADERGRPDDEKREELVEQDVDPVQEYLCWSGGGELVDA